MVKIDGIENVTDIYWDAISNVVVCKWLDPNKITIESCDKLLLEIGVSLTYRRKSICWIIDTTNSVSVINAPLYDAFQDIYFKKIKDIGVKHLIIVIDQSNDKSRVHYNLFKDKIVKLGMEFISVKNMKFALKLAKQFNKA